MAKMSRIDQTIQDIKKWFKNHIEYIVAIIFVFIIAIYIYRQADKDMERAREKENRITTIENRLTIHENYMHEVKADIDNLYEVVDK